VELAQLRALCLAKPSATAAPTPELPDWIDDSYDLVAAGLPKRVRAKLG
jgi:predicted DNA-binding protein (MmcQ/YjbR family)